MPRLAVVGADVWALAAELKRAERRNAVFVLAAIYKKQYIES
jgi:hypothetical protein